MDVFQIVQVHTFPLREIAELRIRNSRTGEEYEGTIRITAAWRERSALIARNVFADLERELAVGPHHAD